MKNKLTNLQKLIQVEAIINDEATYNLWQNDFLVELSRPFFFLLTSENKRPLSKTRGSRLCEYLLCERRYT